MRHGLKTVVILVWAISSQAAWGQVEGSTTRPWSVDHAVKALECGTSQVDDEIVWTAGKPVGNKIDDATEGTDLSNIEFSTGVAQLTCAEYGILMEVTDTLVEDAIGGLDLFGIINSHMARALALAWSDDFCALFPSITAQVGTTTTDLTIAQLLAAQTGIRTRGTVADDGLVYCLDNEQVLNVETALSATGTSMAVYAAAIDRIFGFGPGPNQGMGESRHVLNFRGYPVHATGLTDTVATAADVAGACFTPYGPRNDEYSTFGNAIKRLPRFETQRFAKARGTELVLTMRMGVGLLLNASATEIATDAP